VDVVLQGVLQGASKLHKFFRIKVVGSEGIEPPIRQRESMHVHGCLIWLHL